MWSASTASGSGAASTTAIRASPCACWKPIPRVAVDAAWFARKIADAVRLRREVLKLDEVTDAWRVVHSEGDGLSGLVVDRYADLLVVEFFSAGMFRHREWIYDALREQFPGCRFYASPTSTCRSRRASTSAWHANRPRAGADHRARHPLPRRSRRRAQDRLLRRPARQPRVAVAAVRRQARARPVLQHRRLRRLRRRCAAPARWSASTSTRTCSRSPRATPSSTTRGSKFVQADIFPWLRDAGQRAATSTTW